MTAVSIETAVLTALVVYIQFLVAVVVIIIAASVIKLIGRMLYSLIRLVAPAVFPRSAHALISFHCVFGIVATCQPMPSSAVALS